VSDLYRFFGIAAAVIFVVVVGLIGWAIIRYRNKEGDALPEQFRGNVKLEILWFAVPQVIVIGLFVASMLTQNQVNATVGDPDVRIETVGFQWGWRFTYPDAGVTIVGTPQDPAEVVVPVGEDISFELEARDVNHAFYVPRFLIKRDVIPGRVNRIDLRLDEAGTYKGACAEFCGLLHDRMTFTVRAVSPDAFDSWLEEQQGDK
jgi:cytochrome c oxidase subunit II